MRVGIAVGVVMRGVDMNSALVAVDEGMKSGVGVRVAVGVRGGLKKKGVRVGVVRSSCPGRGVRVLVGARVFVGGGGVFVCVGTGVRVGGGEVGEAGVPTTMLALSLAPPDEAATV